MHNSVFGLRVFALALIVALPSVLGCNSGTAATAGDSLDTIYPLRVGNSWTYRQTDYDPTGNVIGDTTGTVRVVSEGSYHGIHALRVDIEDGGEFLQWIAGSNVYSVDASDSTSIPSAFLHYPMGVGEAWSDTSASHSSSGYLSLKVVGLTDPISTKAGSFACVHFQSFNLTDNNQTQSQANLASDVYCAKGVGIVLSKQYARSNGQPYLFRIQSLESYTVK